MKVFDLANQLGVPSLELVKLMREQLGLVDVKNHMSEVDESGTEAAKIHFKKIEEEKRAAAKTKKAVVRKKVAPVAPTVAVSTPMTKEAPVQQPVVAAPSIPAPAIIRRSKIAQQREEEEALAAAAAAAAEQQSLETFQPGEPEDETALPTEEAPATQAPAHEAAKPLGFRSATILSRPDKPPAFRPPRALTPGLPRPLGSRGPLPVIPIDPLDPNALRKERDGKRHEEGGPSKAEDEAALLARRKGAATLRVTETFDPREYFKKMRGGDIASVKRKRSALGRPAKKTLITRTKESKRVVEVHGEISVNELAHQLSVKVSQVLNKLAKMGSTDIAEDALIDFDTASLVANEFEFEAKNLSFDEDVAVNKVRRVDGTKKNQLMRAPVVTVMGHVDHGKTSLLDRMRKANVAAGEAGGITQHIGAYQVNFNGREITFIDTPGHEAFTKMRARGATTTDIVILVVAADDGVMPQTIEAINHARAANAPLIVAVNKMDVPDAQPDRVRNQLTEHAIVGEEWGGDTMIVPVSAATGDGVDKLLESILVQAEVMELTADPTLPAKCAVLESRLDKNVGSLVTVLVQEGTLRAGDTVVAGTFIGKVRRLMNDQGKPVKEAGPSMPVEVLGMSGVPDAGETMIVVSDEHEARLLIENRILRDREKAQAQPSFTLEQLYQKMQDGQVKELAIILKADVKGSLEACNDALLKIEGPNVKVKLIHIACGGITENDVQLASASKAMIFGFNVRPDTKAIKMAEQTKVTVQTFKIIYEMVDMVKAALTGLLGTRKTEKVLGRAEVRQIFSVPKLGVIAGTSVIDGKITRSAMARLLRDSRIIYEGKISSLRRFKDDVREVEKGYECGIGIENFNDIKTGDVIETFMVEETPLELGQQA